MIPKKEKISYLDRGKKYDTNYTFDEKTFKFFLRRKN